MIPLLLALSAALAACSSLDDSAKAAAPRLERGVVYRTVDSVELALDAVIPPGDGPFPAVILIHGGAWMAGNRSSMVPFSERLVRRGFACFAVSYRLAPKHRYPAQIEDCQHAVQWIRAHASEYRVDATRLAALGPSAGGHLAAMLGLLEDLRDADADDPVRRESSKVQCVVDFFGPSLCERKPSGSVDTQPPPEVFGDAPDSLYAEASPLNAVTKDDAPFLLIHGDKDDSVPIEHSIWLDEKLKKVGVASELLVVAGAGHGDFFEKDPAGEWWKRTDAFLGERLAKPANEKR